MEPVFNFINSNSALWSLLATVATIIYVILTYKLLKETISSREIQNQPNIIVDLELKSIYLKIIVRNVGNSPAQNIKINMEPELANVLNVFSDIKFLAPDKEISNVLSYIFDKDINEHTITKYKFLISYNDISKKPNKYISEYEIDISPFLNAINCNDDENKAIVEKLDKMLSKFDNLKDELRKISDSSKNQADYVKDIKNKLR